MGILWKTYILSVYKVDCNILLRKQKRPRVSESFLNIDI